MREQIAAARNLPFQRRAERVGHWVGMEVHDVDANPEGNILQPGMVFTIEPGLYFKSDDLLVPEEYRGIGVRIEDDVLVTDKGPRVLTSGVPKEVREIEKLMRG